MGCGLRRQREGVRVLQTPESLITAQKLSRMTNNHQSANMTATRAMASKTYRKLDTPKLAFNVNSDPIQK